MRHWEQIMAAPCLHHTARPFHASVFDPVQDSSHNNLDHHNEGHHDEDVMPLKTRGATPVLKG